MKKIFVIIALGSLLQGCLVPEESVKPNVSSKTQKTCKSDAKNLQSNFTPSKETIQLTHETAAVIQVLFKQSGLKITCQVNKSQRCQFVSVRNKNVYTAYDLEVSNPQQLLVRSYTYGYGMLQTTTFNSYRCQ